MSIVASARRTRTGPDATASAKLRKLAEGLQVTIDKLSRPMSQAWTPKRGREYGCRMFDAHNAQLTQRALLALAAAHEAGACPPALAGLRTKAAISPLVRAQRHCGSGYYDAPYALDDFADKSPIAQQLQQLLNAPPVDTTEVRLRQALDRLRDRDLPGFFPTPRPLAEQMVHLADISPGTDVLEPSAGIGSLAEVIREQHPAAKLCCVEVAADLVEILTLKGFDCAHDDFLAYRQACDRVVMNPPFERGQDIAHIQHAWSMLRAGGRLVALVSPGPFFRQDKKSSAFRAWLSSQDVEVNAELPAGTFNVSSAFRRTAVNARLLVISKEPL
jgi:predicted RNA methylase